MILEEFVVRGASEFPIRALASVHAFPATFDDADAIENTMKQTGGGDVKVVLRRFVKKEEPVLRKLWSAYGWEVVSGPFVVCKYR